MSLPIDIARLRSREGTVLDPSVPDRTIYVRDGGNGPGTQADPCGNLDDVLAAIDLFGHGRRTQRIDCTGFNPTEVAERSIAPGVFGSRGGVNFGHGGADQVLGRETIEWVAAPTKIQPLTITNVASAAYNPLNASGITEITVAETLVAGAHVGQFVFSNFNEYGVITGHTANVITAQTFTGGTFTAGPDAGIYELSSTWTFGDPANFFTSTLLYQAMCSTAFVGIDFVSGKPGGSAASFSGAAADFNFNVCRFDRAHFAARGVFDACHFANGILLDPPGSLIRASLIGNPGGQFLSHAFGVSEFSDMTIRGVASFGQGSSKAAPSSIITRCLIEDAPEHGLYINGPGESQVTNSVIRNCTGDGIHKTGGGQPIHLDNVEGTGNGGYGIYLENGAQAALSPQHTITGALGDIRVGGAGAVAHAAIPAHDGASAAPEFCRAYPI